MNTLSCLFSQTPKLSNFIKLVHKQPMRLFYFCFLPKKIRQNLNNKAILAQKKIIAKNADTFIQYYIDDKLTKFNLLPKRNLVGKKIIWQYWGQGLDNDVIPETVNICFNSVDKYKNDYEVIRLDDKNISDYLDIPNFVWRKRKNQMFKHAFFSDLLRLALLDVYGGIWIDATILLTDTIPKNITEMDFFIFQRSIECKQKELFQNLNAEYFQWESEHFINMLNSFIVSKPKNILTHTCLDLLLNYWQTQNDIKHYFFFQIIFNQLITNSLYKQFNCPIFDDTYPHLLQMKLTSPFVESDYNDIKVKSTIHKMTYIHKYPKNSYYEYLKDEFYDKN